MAAAWFYWSVRLLLSNRLWFSFSSSPSRTTLPELAFSDLLPSDCNLPKPPSSPPLCLLACSFFVVFSFFFALSPVHYTKKLEGPTPCTVMVCVNGPAVRTSVRTLDSFWSKNMHYDTDVILEMVPAHLSLLIHMCDFVCVLEVDIYFTGKTSTSYPPPHAAALPLRGCRGSEQRKHHRLSNSTFWPSRQPVDRVQL